MDLTSSWKCIKCGSEQSAEEIEIYVQECQKKIEHTPEDDIENLENLLHEFKIRCHPSHQIGKHKKWIQGDQNKNLFFFFQSIVAMKIY